MAAGQRAFQGETRSAIHEAILNPDASSSARSERCGPAWTGRGHHENVGEGPLATVLVATENKMIPPDAQRAMSKRAGSTVVEARGSHAVYVSQPQAVATIITKAVHGVVLATH